MGIGSRRACKVREGGVVNWEEAGRRAILRRHVPYGGPIWHGELRVPFSEILHEGPHDVLLSEPLGDSQDEVGRSDALLESPGEPDSEDLRDGHVVRLAEHHRFGFYPSNPPPQAAEAVHHGGVRIGADQGVGEGLQGPVLRRGCHHLGEVFEVELVADSLPRREDPHPLEGSLGPFQKRVAFRIPFVFLL